MRLREQLKRIEARAAVYFGGALCPHRSPALREAQSLVRELQDFRVTITEAANDTYGGRTGAHDDLVLAVALACWGALHESLAGPFAVFFQASAKVKMPGLDGSTTGGSLSGKSGGTSYRKIVRG